MADYSITVLNDGNMALGPINVKDSFPIGAVFLESTIEPFELTSRIAKWSIPQLGIGESVTIDLSLRLTRRTDQLVSRTRAESAYQEKRRGKIRERKVSASNTSTLAIDWERCETPKMSATMTATPDSSEPAIVRYRLTIQNLADYEMNINVTDTIPEGMTFLDSRIAPSRVETGEVVWVLEGLAPGKRRTVEYTTEAEGEGLFMNRALIDACSADGQNSTSTEAVAALVIGGTPDIFATTASGWLPCDVDLADEASCPGSSPCLCCKPLLYSEFNS